MKGTINGEGCVMMLPVNGRGKETERLIKGLELNRGGGQTLFWSNEIPGFGVLVGKTSRTYVVRGRIGAGGKSVRIKVGSVAVWSFEDAKARGREMLMTMASGVDPREAARAAAANEGWKLGRMVEWVRERKGAGYGPDVDRYLSDWFPLNSSEITGRKVEARYREILAKLAGRKGATDGVATANNTMKYLRAIWNSVNRLDDELGRNPVDALKGVWIQDKAREDRIDEDKLGAFWQEIWAEPFDAGRDVVIFMLLTGMRRQVACSLTVDEYDHEAGVLRITGERMKAGRDFEVPVSKEVASMLDRRMGISRHGYMFEGKTAGRGKRRVSAEPWVKEPRYVLDRVGERAWFKCSVHGLRRTFGSEAAWTTGEIQRKRLMAHTLGGDVTSAHYSVIGLEALRPAAQAVSDRIIGYASDADDVRRRIASGEGTGPGWRERTAEQLDKNLVIGVENANANDPGYEALLAATKTS